MTTPAASVIIRTYNSQGTISAALESVRRQSLPVEIVVVDSGSSDRTLETVEAYADRLIRLSPAEFTFGGALNTGAAAATTPVHVALSSHCILPREDWITIAKSHIDGGAVAACGLVRDARRHALAGPFKAHHDYLRAHRFWGFSNHASAWSAESWARHRFAEHLAAAEDKEWSWRATAEGGYIVADPRLVVPSTHRRAAGARAYYRRLLRELPALQEIHPLPPYPASQAVLDWARRTPHEPSIRRSRACGRTRLIEVAARWRAGRQGR